LSVGRRGRTKKVDGRLVDCFALALVVYADDGIDRCGRILLLDLRRTESEDVVGKLRCAAADVETERCGNGRRCRRTTADGDAELLDVDVEGREFELGVSLYRKQEVVSKGKKTKLENAPESSYGLAQQTLPPSHDAADLSEDLGGAVVGD
jgi:hypothetical protein